LTVGWGRNFCRSGGLPPDAISKSIRRRIDLQKLIFAEVKEMNKLLFIVLIVVTVNTAFTADRMFTTDAEMAYTLKLKYAEIKFTVDKSYYLVGDSVRLTTEIKCLTDKELLVFDPVHYLPGICLSIKDHSITSDLGLLYDRDDYGVLQLKIIKKNQSVKYTVKEVIPPNAIDSLKESEAYTVDFDARYWIFSENLIYWTYPKDDPRRLKTNHGRSWDFIGNSRLEYSTTFEIRVNKNYDRLEIER
jgi:hypothetical protein